jgi:hypothetical protein
VLPEKMTAQAKLPWRANVEAAAGQVSSLMCPRGILLQQQFCMEVMVSFEGRSHAPSEVESHVTHVMQTNPDRWFSL